MGSAAVPSLRSNVALRLAESGGFYWMRYLRVVSWRIRLQMATDGCLIASQFWSNKIYTPSWLRWALFFRFFLLWKYSQIAVNISAIRCDDNITENKCKNSCVTMITQHFKPQTNHRSDFKTSCCITSQFYSPQTPTITTTPILLWRQRGSQITSHRWEPMPITC